MSRSIPRIMLVVAACAIAAVGIVGVQTVPAAAAAAPAYLRHPAKNIAPGRAFMSACYRVTHSAASQAKCSKAALVVYAKARKSEGLGPLVLPKGFAAMPDAKQLLVLSNLERIDRGLPPAVGLSPALNALAKQGALADADPTPPAPPSDLNGSWAAASNWAGAGSSTLLDSFFWMYDDGLNSGNVECTTAERAGCWGHRDDILLRAGQTPYVMGAASLPDTASLKSMTELFVGGDRHFAAKLSTAWAPIAKSIPVGVSATKVTATAAAHHVAKKRLVLYASGVSGKVTVKVAKGAAAWTVSPSSCALKAGHECAITITFHAVKRGSLPGTLAVKGPNGTRLVALAGRGR